MGATLGTSLLLTLALTCLVGMTVFGSQMNFASLTTMNYPPHMRSTGVGWAMAVGRLGSVVGPLIAGALVGAGLQAGALISWSALAAGLAAILVLLLGLRLRRNARVGASELAEARS